MSSGPVALAVAVAVDVVAGQFVAVLGGVAAPDSGSRYCARCGHLFSRGCDLARGCGCGCGVRGRGQL